MKTETRQLLEKAGRSIEAAELLAENDQPDFSASRSYYAMFYVAEGLLNEKGLQFSKHGNVHAAFGEHFAKTGLFDPKYHHWLIDAFARGKWEIMVWIQKLELNLHYSSLVMHKSF